MKKITLWLFALFTCWQVNAQVSSYAFSQSAGTYTPISGGTSLASYTAATTGATRMDDVIYNIPNGTIPFQFFYNGTGFTGCNVSSNGFITFGATAPDAGNYAPLSSTNLYSGAISAFGRDLEGGFIFTANRTSGSADLLNVSNVGSIQVGDFLDGTGIPTGATVVSIVGTTITMSANATSTGTAGAIRVGGPSSNIQYATEGVAPNRVFVIQYSNFKRFGTTLTTTQHMVLNFQFRLHETTGEIRIVYGTNSPGLTTFTTTNQVGLRGVDSAFATNVNNRANTKNVNDDWLNSVAGTANTSGMLFNNVSPANVISSGLTYTWTPPSCSAPGGFVASAITPTAATISWNAVSPAPATGYEYFFSTTNATPTVAGTPTTALSANLTSLSVNTTYFVWLRSDCGSGTFSAWSGPFTFATPCNPNTIPYFEGFESGYVHNTNVAGCITQASVTGTQVWTANSTLTDFNRTPRTGSFNAFLRYGNEDWLFIPIELVGGTSYRVQFFARQDGAIAANSNMAISYGTANNAAAMTNVVTAATGIINGNYQEIVGDFVPATSGVYYVGIKGFMNFSPNFISIDDISIDVTPPCINPSSLSVNSISTNSVNFLFNGNPDGSQLDFAYVVQPQGTGAPTTYPAGTLEDGTNTVNDFNFVIPVTGLLPATNYEIYVAANCNGTWVGPLNFVTACTAVTDFSQGFETTTGALFPTCWSKVGPDGLANTQASTGISGARNLYMYSTTAASRPVVSMIPVSNASAGTHRMKMKVRANFTPGETLELGYLTNPTDATTFTSISSIVTNSTTVAQDFITVPSGMPAGDVVFALRTGTALLSVLVDDVVWEPIPAAAPSCASNIVATPNATCGNFANTITWDVTSGADGYYVFVGTTPGGIDVSDGTTPVATNSFTFTGAISTTYYYTIVPFNAIGSATGCTEASFTTVATGCYCTSAPTSVDGNGITNVQIGTTNFPSTVTVAPFYNDFTATPVDMSQGISNNVQISYDTGFGYTYPYAIFIDANDDFTFDASEIVATGTVSNTPAIQTVNASFVMPGTIPLGNHRMRIVTADSAFDAPNPFNPCYSGTWGETADFTVNIVAASCAPPVATATVVPACGTAQFSVDVNVTALGSGTPSITDGTTTWPITAVGVVNVGPFASGATVNLTVLHGTDATCNLPLSAITYTCPAANDNLCNAIALTVNAISTGTQYNNIGSTAETNEPIPACFNDDINGSVWFSFIAPASGEVNITTDIAGATLDDTEIAVYAAAGVTCSDLSTLGAVLGCDQDSGTTINFNSFLNLAGLTAGNTYYIQVDKYSDFNSNGSFGIEVQEVLSSDSFDNANFIAYPNPVKDIFNVSYSSEISSVRVINLLGQEVVSKQVNATSTQVDMSQLSAGTYIVNVTVGDTIKTIKVVKQ